MAIFDRHRRYRKVKSGLGDFDHPALSYKKPKQLRRFQLVVSFIASAALVFGLWSFAWYAMSSWVKAEIAGWVDQQMDSGAVAEFTNMKTGGFPNRIVVSLSEPHYDGPAFGQSIAWRGDMLVITAKPWTPWNLRIEAPGKHELNIGGRWQFDGAAERLVMDVNLGEVWPDELDLNVQGLSMNGSAPLAAGRLRISAEHNPDAQASETGLSLRIQGDDIIWPGGLPQPLGDRIAALDVVARLNGNVNPGPLGERLTAWQESGGVLDVERLRFRGGPLGVAAGGNLVLDQQLQPEATFTAKFEGLFQVVEILRAKGLMKAGDAVVATMALSALSRRSDDGGAPSINVGVSVRDGVLRLGPLEVMKMPHIDWGIPAPVPDQPAPEADPEPPKRDYKDVPPVL